MNKRGLPPSTIRPLEKSELDTYLAISRAAYPGIQRPWAEARQHVEQEFERPEIEFMGLFRQQKLLGILRRYDFTMTVRDQQMAVGGVGGVAVDLLHKKQRVAYEMMQHFLLSCRYKGQPMALLYPFRPDFYARMGFGYGTPLAQYRVTPAGLPKAGMDHLRMATEKDRSGVVACYNRKALTTHGMIRRQVVDARHLWREGVHTLLYDLGNEGDGGIEGYLSFRFVPGDGENFLRNDLRVLELIYETPEALAQLLTFLHVQQDQVTRVIFNSQDEHLHFLFTDPRDDSERLLPSVYHQVSAMGLGWMVRVVDLTAWFQALKETNWGCGGFTLCLEMIDDFLPQNQGRTLINFDRTGRAHMTNAQPSVTIQGRVQELSSLLMGVVPLSWLVQSGQITISSATYIPPLDRAFRWSHKPICLTDF
jgi:predicted acetyltransferase